MDIKEPIGRQRDRVWPQLVTLEAKLSLLADKDDVNPNCRDVSEKLVAFCRQQSNWLARAHRPFGNCVVFTLTVQRQLHKWLFSLETRLAG